jgi:dTDP-L-rhamnose 4-epimerase
MRVLITGGAGFIGSHTTDMLIENGYQVRIMDIFDRQIHQGRQPEYLNKKCEVVVGDVRNRQDWEKCLKDTDIVIHLAARTGIGQSMYEPASYSDTNVNGTAMLYDVLLKNPSLKKGIKKIVVASSKTIYGEGAYHCKNHGTVYPEARTVEQLKRSDWELHCPQCGASMTPVGIGEEKPPQTPSVYGMTKFATERLAVMLGDALGIPTIAFRWFSAYGPRQSLSNPYTGVCSIFLSRLKNGNQPVIFEDGKQLRDYVFVKDVAMSNLLAIKNLDRSGVYNIGSGKPADLTEVSSTLAELLGVDIKPKFNGEFRVGDTRHDFADITKAKKELGFAPKWSLKAGLKELIDWGETQEAVDRFQSAEAERKRAFSS